MNSADTTEYFARIRGDLSADYRLVEARARSRNPLTSTQLCPTTNQGLMGGFRGASSSEKTGKIAVWAIEPEAEDWTPGF